MQGHRIGAAWRTPWAELGSHTDEEVTKGGKGGERRGKLLDDAPGGPYLGTTL